MQDAQNTAISNEYRSVTQGPNKIREMLSDATASTVYARNPRCL